MARLLRKDGASTISPSNQAALQANTTGPSRRPCPRRRFPQSDSVLFQVERVSRGVKAEARKGGRLRIPAKDLEGGKVQKILSALKETRPLGLVVIRLFAHNPSRDMAEFVQILNFQRPAFGLSQIFILRTLRSFFCLLSFSQSRGLPAFSELL